MEELCIDRPEKPLVDYNYTHPIFGVQLVQLRGKTSSRTQLNIFQMTRFVGYDSPMAVQVFLLIWVSLGFGLPFLCYFFLKLNLETG